jgi:hypothetical protein
MRPFSFLNTENWLVQCMQGGPNTNNNFMKIMHHMLFLVLLLGLYRELCAVLPGPKKISG